MFFNRISTIAIGLAYATSCVSAHGYLKSIDVAGTKYIAWVVGQDDYVTPRPVRFSRRTPDNGPVVDFTGPDITCNRGGNVPSAGIIDVRAGDNVRFVWDWGSSHPGPVMTYVAKCTPDCASFKGDTGAVWIKIEESSWSSTVNPKWASERVTSQGGNWVVNIPAALPNGEYLLRHEILGLHGGYEHMGAQFYPHCSHIRITNGGSTTPSGGISLPGAYDPKDPGILFSIYGNGAPTYKAPGGPVWSGATQQLFGVGSVPAVTRTVSTWTQAPTGLTTSSASTPTTTATVTTVSRSSTVTLSTTTSAASTPTPPTSGGTVQAWGQCGGIGYTGATTCVSGYKCQKYNDHYSQCTPA